jgi:uncharacterized membrane protein
VHHRFVISAVASLITLFLPLHLPLATRLLIGWSTFAFFAIVLAWIVLFTRDPYEVRRTASIQDSNATVLFTLVISAAMISLLAVGVLLGSAKSLPKAELGEHVALSVASVIVSWFLVHTLFALRYAHLFYSGAHQTEREKVQGGLDFPGDDSPVYLDFAYFSFVVGMTCQVSDVQVSSTSMRRLTLVHGLISFCFNTAIIAMFVNIVASLV